jgi:putative DNA primase/helicase
MGERGVITALTVRVEGIPEALRAERRWVLWRYVSRGEGRWAKVPHRTNGRRASASDPTSWTTFETALKTYRRGGYDGIGFVLGDGWGGVDLDDCRDVQTGVLLPEAQAIVDRFAPCYTEESPSGEGVKMFFHADRTGFQVDFDFNPAADGAVTEWNAARYFAVTGGGGGDATVDRTAEVSGYLDLHRHDGHRAIVDRVPDPGQHDRPDFIAEGRQGREHLPEPKSVATMSDEDLLARARAARDGEKFRALWRGDISAYDDDHSRADMALCCLLAFWTQKDETRMDQLFRQSGLYRREWERTSYRRVTLAKAIQRTPQVYDPPEDRMGTPVSVAVLVGVPLSWVRGF